MALPEIQPDDRNIPPRKFLFEDDDIDDLMPWQLSATETIDGFDPADYPVDPDTRLFDQDTMGGSRKFPVKSVAIGTGLAILAGGAVIAQNQDSPVPDSHRREMNADDVAEKPVQESIIGPVDPDSAPAPQPETPPSTPETPPAAEQAPLAETPAPAPEAANLPPRPEGLSYTVQNQGSVDALWNHLSATGVADAQTVERARTLNPHIGNFEELQIGDVVFLPPDNASEAAATPVSITWESDDQAPWNAAELLAAYNNQLNPENRISVPEALEIIYQANPAVREENNPQRGIEYVIPGISQDVAHRMGQWFEGINNLNEFYKKISTPEGLQQFQRWWLKHELDTPEEQRLFAEYIAAVSPPTPAPAVAPPAADNLAAQYISYVQQVGSPELANANIEAMVAHQEAERQKAEAAAAAAAIEQATNAEAEAAVNFAASEAQLGLSEADPQDRQYIREQYSKNRPLYPQSGETPENPTWCMDFASTVMQNAFGDKWQEVGFGQMSGVWTFLQWSQSPEAMARGWQTIAPTELPQRGDIAVWKSNGASHVGIVVGADPATGTFESVEGNVGGPGTAGVHFRNMENGGGDNIVGHPTLTLFARPPYGVNEIDPAKVESLRTEAEQKFAEAVAAEMRAQQAREEAERKRQELQNQLPAEPAEPAEPQTSQQPQQPEQPAKPADLEPHVAQFVHDYEDEAAQAAQKYGIDPEVYTNFALAQAGLESGWGSSGLTREANNFFGIQDFPNDRWEGANIKKKDKLWRQYANAAESFDNHLDMIVNGNNFYDVEAKLRAGDVHGAVDALVDPHTPQYTPDEGYAESIHELVDEIARYRASR